MSDLDDTTTTVADARGAWMREALTHLFDLDFLRQHLATLPAHAQIVHPDPLSVQDAIIAAIESLRPQPTVSIRSEQWRIYQILNLRYRRGQSQAETASEMNCSVRQLRREQTRAIRTVAALLLPDTMLRRTTPGGATAGTGMIAETPSETLRIDMLLRSALTTIDPLLQQQDLRVQVIIADALPVLHCEPMIARQLVLNALVWMTHACGNTLLTIQAEKRDSLVCLRFVRPCPPPHLAAMAGSFENAQRLADMIEAQVSVTPENASGASSLSILLPASQSICVLVVDDNADAIQLVRRYLRRNNRYHLITAATPDEALRLATEARPGVIVLDVMLPGRDGWEVLTLLKTHPRTAHIPVIVSSVLQQPELSRALGAAGLLPKPFDAEALIRSLDRALTLPTPCVQE